MGSESGKMRNNEAVEPARTEDGECLFENHTDSAGSSLKA